LHVNKINNAVLNFGNAKRMCLFCLMMQNKMHGFTWAEQDWIGLIIFKNFADQDWIRYIFCRQDWTWTEKFHSPLISVHQS